VNSHAPREPRTYLRHDQSRSATRVDDTVRGAKPAAARDESFDRDNETVVRVVLVEMAVGILKLPVPRLSAGVPALSNGVQLSKSVDFSASAGGWRRGFHSRICPFNAS